MSSSLQNFFKLIEDEGMTVRFGKDLCEDCRRLIQEQADEFYAKYRASLQQELLYGVDDELEEVMIEKAGWRRTRFGHFVHRFFGIHDVVGHVKVNCWCKWRESLKNSDGTF